MSVLEAVFGTALFATGTAGWVVTTRVNGNPFAGLKERSGVDSGLEGDETAPSAEGDEEETFSFEGRVDYKPGAKRRLLAIGLLIVTVAVVGAILAGLVGLIVWIVNSAVVGYMNGG